MPAHKPAPPHFPRRSKRGSIEPYAGRRILAPWPIKTRRLWRNIAPALLRGKPSWPGAYSAIRGSKRLRLDTDDVNLWTLVLEAKRIPFRLEKVGSRRGLFVPVLYEGVALAEIRALERESAGPLPVAHDFKPVAWPGMLLALVLLVWHGLRWGWFGSIVLPVPPFPVLPGQWVQAFGLDVYRTQEWGQWWRVVTALWIHGDNAHLLSNMVFGGVFLGVLARRTGASVAFALAILGGATGNAVNVLVKQPGVVSLGFSTSVFAIIGGLCAYACLDVVRISVSASKRQRELALCHARESGADPALCPPVLFFPRGLEGFVRIAKPVIGPLVAGLAFLALLGGAGAKGVDYAAHIFGLLGGIFWGLVLWTADQRFAFSGTRLVQRDWGLFALISLAIWWCWQRALYSN